MTSKGKYYWSIKLEYHNSTANQKGEFSTPDQIATELKSIDDKLREKFPKNVADQPGGSLRFQEHDLSED